MTRQQQVTRGTRTVRGLIVAAVATFVAALSHIAAGGNTPSLTAMFLCLGIALPFVVFLSGKKSPVGVALSVAGTQTLFHWLFVWIAPAAAQLTQMRWTSHAEHLAAMSRSWSPTLAPTTASGAQALMFFAHAIAGVLTYALLRYADAAFTTIQKAWLRLRLRVTRAFTLPEPISPVRVPVERVFISLKFFSLHPSRSLRGPPALLM